MMLQVQTGLLLHKLKTVNGSFNCSYFYRTADLLYHAIRKVCFYVMAWYGPWYREKMELLPVFNKRWEVSAWEPQGVANSQNPQDGQFVQHLAHITQGHVKIHGENT